MELAAEFTDPIKASEYLKINEVDFAFLDVEMPGMTGLEMINSLKLPQIILMSAKKEYAVEAFENDLTDFIYKPIDYERFLRSVEKVKSLANIVKVNKEEIGSFFIKDSKRYIKLNVNDIIYVEALGDYVNIHTKDTKHTILSTMKYMEEMLSIYNFIRIHRSYIINPLHVKEFEKNTVYIKEKPLPLSRFFKKDFLKGIKKI